jgi:hypothetical protein
MHGVVRSTHYLFLLLPTVEGPAWCLTCKPGMLLAVASTFPSLYDQGYMLVLPRCLDEVSITCAGAISLQAPLIKS